ncbi:MAG: hypothetical protein ACR2NX_11615 [Chthoniobacterales bacterium]
MNPEATAPIRVVLADDHSVVRLGLRQMIELDDPLTIVAEAADGKAALAAVREHAPGGDRSLALVRFALAHRAKL